MSVPGYYRYPTIHQDLIVFSCEDDLWAVSADGGTARRLTAGLGECSMPRFSPDGKLLAFVGSEEGHPEVYVMPSAGGLCRRLTFLGAKTCTVCGWTPDGREILFISDSASPFVRHRQAFAVPADGGMPRLLGLGHVESISISSEGAVAIGRNSSDPARWKRYKGGTAGDIWVDKSGSGTFHRLTTLGGNLVWPMWVDSRVYFLSDHEGVGNIYSCLTDGSDLRQHTNQEEYFARFPSTDGNRIVYSAGADIHVYDVGGNSGKRLEIDARSTAAQASRKFVDAKARFEHFAPHPEGISVSLIARGQPFTMPNWEEAAIQHGLGSKVRYRLTEWLPDGKRFIVVSDSAGFERIEVHQADQSQEPAVGSQGDIGRVVALSVSPCADAVAVGNHRHELMIVDLLNKQERLIDRSPGERITDLSWSSDGRFVAYAWSPTSGCSLLRIAEVETGITRDVTDALRIDRAPCFDAEGKYLYFLSTRDFNPVYDAVQFDLGFPQATRPFLIALRKDVASPFVDLPRPLVKRSESGGKAEAVRKPTQNKAPQKVEIDFDGISGRILSFPVEEGRYEHIASASGRVLFTHFPTRGIKRGGIWWNEEQEVGDLMVYDFEEQRSAVIHKEVGEIRLANDSQTLVYRCRNNLRVVDALEKLPAEGQERTPSSEPGRKSGWLDLSRVRVLVNPQDEWEQMYREAWRLQKEHFWDERMSEVDWDLVFNRYHGLVSRVRTRREMSDLIWEMQGELGTSHAYEMGGDHRQSPAYVRGFLGADLVYDEDAQGYRINKIYRGDSWDVESDSPFAQPGLQVQEGDVILAVGGRKAGKDCSVDELLINAAGSDMVLSLQSGKEKRSVIVKTLKDERYLRYRHWVDSNRRIVHEYSQGRVGYVHIPDMGPWGFGEFHRGYLAECEREGLIVDVRYNSGGHISPLLLQKLARKRVGYDVSRWGKPQPYPPASIAGPMVALTNQFAGSDGDIFSHCFKLYGLGPLVGMRTWGGVVGIWPRHRLVDGTVTTQPEFSFWFVDVGWKVENYGTDPDIEVDILPQDYRNGQDPQLGRALELIMDQLSEPIRLPEFAGRPVLPLPYAAKAGVKTS